MSAGLPANQAGTDGLFGRLQKGIGRGQLPGMLRWLQCLWLQLSKYGLEGCYALIRQAGYMLLTVTSSQFQCAAGVLLTLLKQAQFFA